MNVGTGEQTQPPRSLERDLGCVPRHRSTGRRVPTVIRFAVSPVRARIHLSWSPWTGLADGFAHTGVIGCANRRRDQARASVRDCAGVGHDRWLDHARIPSASTAWTRWASIGSTTSTDAIDAYSAPCRPRTLPPQFAQHPVGWTLECRAHRRSARPRRWERVDLRRSVDAQSAQSAR